MIFLFPRDIWQSNSFPSNPSNIVRHHRGGHVQTMALNHLFWSEKSHTGLHLVPCSSWHHLKHAILLSSILCVTFQVPPVAPAKAQFPLARTVITSADKNVCFQFKPTQFHLAPALTLLGSRDSAGAAAGEEWEGRAVQGHPKAMWPRWLWPLSPVPAAPALLCVQCPGSEGTGQPQVRNLLDFVRAAFCPTK